MQRCVGLLVTLLLRSLSALWTQDIQDIVQLWTCERPWNRLPSNKNINRRECQLYSCYQNWSYAPQQCVRIICVQNNDSYYLLCGSANTCSRWLDYACTHCTVNRLDKLCSGSCLQMEFRCYHVHAARGLSTVLAQETDTDAAHDLSGDVRLLLSWMGRPLRHGQRFGNLTFAVCCNLSFIS